MGGNYILFKITDFIINNGAQHLIDCLRRALFCCCDYFGRSSVIQITPIQTQEPNGPQIILPATDRWIYTTAYVTCPYDEAKNTAHVRSAAMIAHGVPPT